MCSIAQPAESRRGLLLVFFSAVLWGTVGIATQAIYRQSELTPFTVGFFRLAIAWPVVAALCWAMLGKGMFQVGRRHVLRMTLVGAMLALYQVCYFAAIGYVGVAVATLVTLCTAPVIVALVSVIFLQEALTRGTLLALACALSGTALLIGFPAEFTARTSLMHGVALALGSATGYAIVAIAGRSLAGECHPVLSTTVSFGTGAIFLFPLAITSGISGSYAGEIWGLLLYVGVVPTAVAYVLFFFGMRYIKASAASILTMVEPLTATLLAWLLFDERLGATGALGAVLLVTAIAVLSRGEKVRGKIRRQSSG